MLAARGVPRTPEALAGAMLEAHKDLLIVGLVEGLSKMKPPSAAPSRSRIRR
jgi:hypothetical protein